jgi:hypothetical protein
MNIPQLVSKSSLQAIDTSKDTHAVRVVLHDANNPGAYRLACHSRTYLFEKNSSIGKHSLDIPVSVWMHGTAGGRFQTAASISDDFRTASGASLSFQVIPLREAAATEGPGEVVALLRKLLSGIGAPAPVQHTFAMLEAGVSFQQIRKFVEDVLEAIDDEEPEETPAQAKARKMREAKAAKKAQLATA